MPNSFKILNWDSDFFGFKVAIIENDNFDVDTINKLMQQHNIKLLYFHSNKQLSSFNNSKIEIKLVDKRVTFYKKLENLSTLNNPFIIDYTLKPIDEQLKILAFESGNYSRFKTDSNINNAKFEALYYNWLKNSLNKIIANQVLVYKTNKQIKGFITLAFKNKIGNIGLFAVGKKHRREGIGKQLILCAENNCFIQNFPTIEVATQKDNEIACMFYKNCGYQIKSVKNIYHIWRI